MYTYYDRYNFLVISPSVGSNRVKSDVEKFRRNEGAKQITFLGSVTDP